LETYKRNYSIIFEKNNEKFTQTAYNEMHLVHCTWLNISAYNTGLPFMVNKQYIQYINASGKFDMLPQSAHQKTLCYCSNNTHYDCYKEILEPAIYPGQTITISFLNYRNTYEFDRKDVFLDTTLPTACIVTNYSETKQSIKHDGCFELKYSIAFPSDNWCELFLRISFFDISHTDIYYITQLPCPIGFVKHNAECQCDSFIKQYNIKYDINGLTILRPPNC